LPRRKVKEWLEKLWEQYEPYADSHFLEAFKYKFGQRSWELYLGVTLLNRGFNLGQHTNIGPDFDIRDKKGNRLGWIEAVTTEKGSGADKVPNIIYGTVIDLPEKEMMFRIANALDRKFKQYCTELADGTIKDDEPYIIAINRSSLDHIDPGLPLILKVLFGIGHLTLRIISKGERQKNPESFWSGRPKISKISGRDVSMLFFEDIKYAGISAVIYCVDSILNSPRLSQDMGENFTIVHNPLAKNPLPDGFFPFGDEYKVEDEYIKKIRERKKWNKSDSF